jgi:hypothetical protein
MTRNKKLVYYLTLIPLILIIILFSWLFKVIFEGEQPSVTVSPLPQYLSQKQTFKVDIEDTKKGHQGTQGILQPGHQRINTAGDEVSF